MLLGLLCPLVFFVVGEPLLIYAGLPGYYATFALLAACFVAGQYRLSRGRADALWRDRTVMAALNAVPLLTAVLMVAGEDVPPGIAVFLVCCAGTLAGAAAAARRRKGTP